MIEIYCDACGNKIRKPKYIKAKVNVGNATDVAVHAYTPSHDLCQNCLETAVSMAKSKG